MLTSLAKTLHIHLKPNGRNLDHDNRHHLNLKERTKQSQGRSTPKGILLSFDKTCFAPAGSAKRKPCHSLFASKSLQLWQSYG
ncbi:hypothetical protein H6G35_01030 [Aulosira sp. FACHB-113]|nr:hypothetical protein [Aulosira sp. FACHB-113]